jgi:hypothetical protein
MCITEKCGVNICITWQYELKAQHTYIYDCIYIYLVSVSRHISQYYYRKNKLAFLISVLLRVTCF